MAGQLLAWHGHTAGSFSLPLIPQTWQSPPMNPPLPLQFFLLATAESQPWALGEEGHVCPAQGISRTWQEPGRDLALMNIGYMVRPGAMLKAQVCSQW